MPTQFGLTVKSFTPPTFPDVPPDLDPSTIRSPHIPNALSPTSPLYSTVSLPSARDRDPLYPATHLQMAYSYKGTAEVISANLTTLEHLTSAGDENDLTLYIVEVPPESICRAKVNHGESPEAEVRVRAWRDHKLLGMWTVGTVADLGLEGFKSQPIHLRRVEHWNATKVAETQN